ncbi:MAG: acyl-CoA thioesterase [Myxococcales bacterium]|nr:acyl-CoA thioesterase [Myxococcales bacterium]MCB9577829.1 acyl-CoA thioesterase [Polyangiaceae bacterium]
MTPPANAHTHRFTVPTSDIDELGHVGNVSWVRWVNEAATEHSRSVGLDLAAYKELGLLWVVRKHEIEYLGSAFAGEELEAATWVDSIKGATSLRQTRFYRDGKLLCRAATTWVLLSIATGRPTRVPPELLARYA